MWYQFIFENIHFAVNVVLALFIFLVGWLYFDAWTERKNAREGVRFMGFFVLAFSFLIHATFVETSTLSFASISEIVTRVIFPLTRIGGYLLVLISLFIEPIQPKPKSAAIMPVVLSATSLPSILDILPFGFPLLSGAVAFYYLHRATVGLENHIKKISYFFYMLTIAELLSTAALFRSTTNIDLYNFVAPFGPIWIVEHAVLIFAIAIMAKWVWNYLLKRLNTQLFMILTTSILVIFLITAVSFSFLLLTNLQNESLKQLSTDVSVLNYAIDSKKAETLSDSQVLAGDTRIASALSEGSKGTLSKIAQDFLLTKNQNLLVILSDTGQVLARGEDKERIGDSLSDDPLVKKAILGKSASSIVTREGVLGPEVSVRSITPVLDGEKVLGSVMVGVTVDNAFVDGVKKATGLEASIYGDNTLSATTLTSSDGKSRAIGIKEEREVVKKTVLSDGKPYSGAVKLLSIPYFASYLPLKDVDNVSVGMLLVGKPQVGVFETAAKSIEATFLITNILLLLSVIPSYFISKYIAEQLK